MLQEFGPNIWIEDGPPITAAAGFHYPTRMAIMRLSNGDLVLWSPTAISDELCGRLQSLGREATEAGRPRPSRRRPGAAVWREPRSPPHHEPTDELLRTALGPVGVLVVGGGSCQPYPARRPPARPFLAGVLLAFVLERPFEGAFLAPLVGTSAAMLRRSASIRLITFEDRGVSSTFAGYDVIEPENELYSFHDLRAAREAARLLEAGYALGEVVDAAAVLRAYGRGLFDAGIEEAAWGEAMQGVGGRLGHLDGQYALPLGDEGGSLNEIFVRAEDCEASGDLPEAERWYRIAGQIDRSNPIIPFNLGNVLATQGRSAEAILCFQLALQRDADFAEVWVNIAALQEEADCLPEAEVRLRRALATRPGDDLALYNLARLLTQQSR